MTAIIETDRILLRRFEASDYEAVYEFSSHPEVQKYTGNPLLKSVQEAKDLIANVWFSDYAKYGYGRWATIYKPDNKLIGFSGLKHLADLGGITDLGYRFLPEYWGKGIATETALVSIKYGFEELGLDRIQGIAMPENIASCRVLEKAGLRFYKTGDYDGDGVNYNWYEIKKGDYLTAS